jgi:3-deoxy-7-phosphoheptulonate synthase
MAAVLTYGASVPVVKVGRMAGQYAKPRSEPTPRPATARPAGLPRRHGQRLRRSAPVARIPTRSAWCGAYHASSATLNLVRAFTTGGFADLRRVHDWNKGFVENAANARYEKLARDIDKAMKFMSACGADFDAMRTTEFFAAHEALLLDYERPLTRIDSRTGQALRHLGALHLGRRAHPGARGRPHRLPRPGSQPHRRQALGQAPMSDDVLRIIDRLDPSASRAG